MSYISPGAIVEAGSYLGRNVTILKGAHVKRGAIIEDNCIVGKPSRMQMERFQQQLHDGGQALSYEDYEAVIDTPTIIGENAFLNSGTIIYSGCTLDEGVICEDKVVVRWDTSVGAHTKLMIGVLIGSYITIGRNSRVGGICGNRSRIGNYVTTFGILLHSYKQYGANHVEPAPNLEDYVTVGYNSNVVGGVTIGTRSYVGAGSMITKDVPPDTVVMGKNEQYPMATYKGGALQQEYLASFPEDVRPKNI